MKKFALLLASLALALLAGGCSSQGSPADAAAELQVVAGDASVIVTWTAEPDVEYWIFWGPGRTSPRRTGSSPAARVIVKATSPRVITGLTNGRTYSFTINGRTDGGPGGPGAPTQVVVPILAGTNWAVGTPLGTGKLNGVAAGLGATGYANVIVGEGGAIYASVAGGATHRADQSGRAGRPQRRAATAASGFVAAAPTARSLFRGRHDVEHEDERHHRHAQRRLPDRHHRRLLRGGGGRHDPHQHGRDDVDGRRRRGRRTTSMPRRSATPATSWSAPAARSSPAPTAPTGRPPPPGPRPTCAAWPTPRSRRSTADNTVTHQRLRGGGRGRHGPYSTDGHDLDRAGAFTHPAT